MSQNMQQWMRATFYKTNKVPGTARKLLEQQLLVLAFEPGPAWLLEGDNQEGHVPCPDDAQVPDRLFLHIGHCNYSTWHFVGMRMNVSEEHEEFRDMDSGCNVLQVAVTPPELAPEGYDHGVVSDLEFMAKMDLTRSWKVKGHMISLSEKHWQHLDASSQVVPLLDVQLSDLEGQDVFWVWRGSVYEADQRSRQAAKKTKQRGRGEKRKAAGPADKKKAKKPKPAEPAGSADVADEGTAQHAAESLDIETIGELLDPYGERAHGSEDEQPDAQEPNDPSAELDERPMEVHPAGGIGSWSDDEEACPNTPERVPSEASMDDFMDHLLQQGSEAVEADEDVRPKPHDAGASPAGELAAEAADAPNPARGSGDDAATERPDRAPFRKSEFQLTCGKLRYYAHTNTLIAICDNPAHDDCRKERSLLAHPRSKGRGTLGGQGRPLGALVHWLRSQFEYDTHQKHMKCKGSKAERLQARECYIIFFRKDKFEKAHVKRFKTLVEDILDWLAANHSPRSMTSLMLEECSPLFAEEWQQTCKQRRGAQAASLQAPQRWQVQSSKIRQELGVGQSTQLWTSHPDLKLAGVPENARVKEVLDLAVYGYLGSDLACQLLAGRQAADAEALKSMCSELFTDISQNPYRKTFTRKNGHAPCMTTATSFYCHSRDRMVLPVEMLYFQGHDLRMKIPSQMPRSSLQSLAGQGICLPVLATLVFCLQNTDSLPV
ncbi:unnamed protein product [Symbiodinium sp. CCMP2592]|nr:unnamed protein product [Symbiodinium sp. CCMP2592]